jgi:hypothetical protein
VTPLRVVVAILFGLMFLSVAGLNGYVFVQGMLRKRRTPSWIPLVGGIAGAIALLVQPWWSRGWWWLPLLLDWGSAPGIVHALVHNLGVQRRPNPPA